MILDLLTIHTNIFASRVVDYLLVIMECATMRSAGTSPELCIYVSFLPKRPIRDARGGIEQEFDAM